MRGILVSAVLLACLSMTVAPAQIWEAAADYSATMNPNGPWSLGWSPSQGGSFTPFTTNGTLCGNLTGWIRTGSAFGFPAIARVDPLMSQCCNTVRAPAGRLVMHPGSQGELAVLRWTAPASGTYEIRLGCTGIDHVFPTTSNIALLINGASSFTDTIAAFDGPSTCFETTYNTTTGFTTTVALLGGDRVEAVLGFGSNATFNGDSTVVDLRITLAGSTQSLGASCGYPSTVLAATNPVLGGPATLSIIGAPAFVTGTLYVSGPPAAPTTFGPGCTIFVDLQFMIPFVGLFTDAGGAWSQTLVIPALPYLSGSRLLIQGLIYPIPAPPGYIITNALDITL